MSDEQRTLETDLAVRAPDDMIFTQARVEEPPAPHGLSLGRLLRGRYGWAVGLGAVLAAAGALAGALLPKPSYKSVGLIDIAPKVPRVLYESDEKGLLPMFDAYVASQAAIVGTRRVLDIAMASPEWKALGRGTTDADVAEFQEHLEVSHPKYSEHVAVAFSDPEPRAAAVAVNEVIKAYMRLVEERETESGQSTVKVLENQRTLASGELNRLRTEVLNVTENMGESALAARYQASIGELTQLDTALQNLDVDLALAKASQESQSEIPQRDLSEQEIAIKDTGMSQFLKDRATLEGQLRHFREYSGYGEKHPDVVTTREAMVVLDRCIAERAAAYRSSMSKLRIAPDEVHEKEIRRAKLADLRAEVQEETKRLGRQRVSLASIEEERSLQAERLDVVKKRLAQIDVESEVHGRIQVVAYGDTPVEPDTDRRPPLAILGGGFGMSLGFGFVMLWGLCESKVRHVVDVTAKSRSVRLLGVVPDASDAPKEAGSEDDPAVMADYCVHHLRTMLQLKGGPDLQVVGLTSPSPGAGKTTLSLALGMSFAAAGSKTLLVDFDFLGRGLTSAMRSLVCEVASRALAATPGERDAASSSAFPRGLVAGLVASRRFTFKDEDVAELAESARARVRAGEKSFATAARALDALARPSRDGKSPASERRGIPGALAGRPLADCVVDVGISNLALLPAGDASEDDTEKLARGVVDRLLAACRDSYDIVLIDTGPVLGSIESALVVAGADETVLVLPRGERSPRVADALKRLQEIGARSVSLIFNRATNADLAASSYASRSTQSVRAGA